MLPAWVESTGDCLGNSSRLGSLGDLHAGEFVLFISHISTGLGLPTSSFFLMLLEDFGLQLQHLTPTTSS